MRWRQVKTDDGYELIPVDQSVRAPRSHAIHGDIQSFVSPIDGEVITGRKVYAEHCKKHNVVNAAEFTPEFYEGKAKERDDHYNGVRTRKERLETKQMMWEIAHTEI